MSRGKNTLGLVQTSSLDIDDWAWPKQEKAWGKANKLQFDIKRLTFTNLFDDIFHGIAFVCFAF
jgi:hypothetical protein